MNAKKKSLCFSIQVNRVETKPKINGDHFESLCIFVR